MGVVNLYRSSSSFENSFSSGNPNPNNFKIESAKEIYGYLILKINYPDCKNYEGNKILVFDKGVTLIDLMNQKIIDPHFSNNTKYISPIARFEPTDRGWTMAIRFAETIS